MGVLGDQEINGGHDCLLGLAALEDDGQGATGEGRGQGFGTGKGFGAKSLEIIEDEVTVGVQSASAYVAGPIAAAEQEAGERVLIGATKDGVPVIEQDGGMLGQELALEVGGRDASGPPRVGGEGAQDGHAGGFAGFFNGGGDVEIGSEIVAGFAGVGVKDPESEDGALGVGADEVLADDLFEGVHGVWG